MPTQGQAPSSLQQILLHVAELTHELSNKIGSAAGLLTIYIQKEDTRLVPDKVAAAADLVSRAVGELRAVMWEINKLRELISQFDQSKEKTGSPPRS